MAAWDELLAWLPEMAGLTVLDSSATSVSMHIDRGNGRTQLVFMFLLNNDAIGEWVAVTTQVGELDSLDVVSILKEGFAFELGGFVATDSTLVFRHSVPFVSFDASHMANALGAVTAIGDSLEAKHTGADRF